MSATPAICATCGSALNSAGVCNRCLFLDFDHEEGASFTLPGLEQIEEIARGGMGVVYKARETATGRVVAVKVPGTRMWDDEDAMRRFAQEVRSAALLDHPHVLPVFEVGRTSDAPFFTMKFAGGGSLAEQAHAHEGDADFFAWIARTLAKVAEAVRFAHERGVLHRDLKPGNILFDEAGEPYVADFGLAKWLDGSVLGESSQPTRTITALGTPHYLAPEIAAGRTNTAATSGDVYALGAILYELLSGRVPHEGSSITLVLRKVADERPDAPSRVTERAIPSDLEAICLKAMEPEPADRYASAAALAEDLRRFVEGDAVLARPLPFAQRAWRWMRKHPGIAALAAALVAVLAVSAAMILGANRKLSGALATSEKNLHDALIEQSRHVRRSLQPDQRGGALQLIMQARERGGATLELRSEAAAALAEPELRKAGEVFQFTPTAQRGAEVAVTTDFAKALFLHRITRRVVLQSLADGRTLWTWSGASQPKPPDEFQLSDSARYAALIFPDHSVEVWDTDADKLLHTAHMPPPETQSVFHALARPFHLHPLVPLIAWVDEHGEVWQRDLESGAQTSVTKLKTRATALRLSSADGNVIALGEGKFVSRHEIGGKRPLTTAVQETGGALLWGQSCLLVADRFTREVLVIEGGRVNTSFRGHQSPVTVVDMARGGRLAFSLSGEGKFCLWDTRDGSAVLEAPAGRAFLCAHENGCSVLAEGRSGRAVRWELEPSRVFREFTNLANFTGSAASGLTASPDGRLVATLSSANLVLWDAHTRKRITTWRTEGDESGSRAAFTPDSGAILYSRVFGAGIFRRSIAWRNDDIVLGEPELVPGTEKKNIGTVLPDGTWVVYDERPRFWRDGTARPLAGDTLDRMHLVSSLGRFAALRFYSGGMLTVTDTASARPCASLLCMEPGVLNFSEDDAWLVLRESAAYRFISTSDWKQRVTWPAGFDAQGVGAAAVSADGRLAAMENTNGGLDLITLPEARLLIRLEPPLPISASALSFSPDGHRLYLLGTTHRLFEWDLQALQEELGKLGLAW